MKGAFFAVAVALVFAGCDTGHKEIGDTACKRLSSCGELVSQGCCVDCNPTTKISLTYACARSISAAPTCNKALEYYNASNCLERSR